MKCSSRHQQLGHFLLRHRYSIQPGHDGDFLCPYKMLVVNACRTQQAALRRHVLELLKYQGHIHLLNDMEQWLIPIFPVTTFDLQQHGTVSNHHFT
jgi:hypothetical protein